MVSCSYPLYRTILPAKLLQVWPKPVCQRTSVLGLLVVDFHGRTGPEHSDYPATPLCPNCTFAQEGIAGDVNETSAFQKILFSRPLLTGRVDTQGTKLCFSTSQLTIAFGITETLGLQAETERLQERGSNRHLLHQPHLCKFLTRQNQT